MRAQRLKKTLQVAVELLPLSGDARSRNRIEETRRSLSDLLHALRRTRGSHKKNGVEAGCLDDPGEFPGFFNGEIRRENAIESGRNGVCRQSLQTVIEKRVV